MAEYDLPGQRALDATLLRVRTSVDALRTAGAVALEAASSGRVKIYGTGVLVSAVTSNVRVTLENPAASGHRLTLIGLAVSSSATGFAQVLVGPTAGLPITAARPALNALVGAGAAAVASVKADDSAVTALSGGTDTGVHFGIGANAPREIALPAPLILTAGVKIGLALNFTTAFNFSARFTFLEEPI